MTLRIQERTPSPLRASNPSGDLETKPHRRSPTSPPPEWDNFLLPHRITGITEQCTPQATSWNPPLSLSGTSCRVTQQVYVSVSPGALSQLPVCQLLKPHPWDSMSSVSMSAHVRAHYPYAHPSHICLSCGKVPPAPGDLICLHSVCGPCAVHVYVSPAHICTPGLLAHLCHLPVSVFIHNCIRFLSVSAHIAADPSTLTSLGTPVFPTRAWVIHVCRRLGGGWVYSQQCSQSQPRAVG